MPKIKYLFRDCCFERNFIIEKESIIIGMYIIEYLKIFIEYN